MNARIGEGSGDLYGRNSLKTAAICDHFLSTGVVQSAYTDYCRRFREHIAQLLVTSVVENLKS